MKGIAAELEAPAADAVPVVSIVGLPDVTLIRQRDHIATVSAIALECSRICTEIAEEHMRHAQGGDNTGASDYRQQAAIECAEAIREAISCGSKETP